MNIGKYAMTVVMLAIFTAMVMIAWQYPPQSRFMPLVVGIPAIALCLLQLYLDLRHARASAPARGGGPGTKEHTPGTEGRKIDIDMPEFAPPASVRRELIMWGYFLGLVGGVISFGFFLTIPVFVVVFLRYWAGTSWRFAIGLMIVASAVLYFVFVQGLGITPYPGFVTGYVLERLSG